MTIINVVLGLLLLMFGRPLYWLFVAIGGFLVGLRLTGLVTVDLPQWAQLAVALMTGGVFALLAMLTVRLAFGIAGFFAGIYLISLLGDWLAWHGGLLTMAWLLGGIAGAVIAAAFADWAVIILSATLGSSLVVKPLTLPPGLIALLFLGLVFASILIQGTILTHHAKRNRPMHHR